MVDQHNIYDDKIKDIPTIFPLGMVHRGEISEVPGPKSTSGWRWKTARPTIQEYQSGRTNTAFLSHLSVKRMWKRQAASCASPPGMAVASKKFGSARTKHSLPTEVAERVVAASARFPFWP